MKGKINRCEIEELPDNSVGAFRLFGRASQGVGYQFKLEIIADREVLKRIRDALQPIGRHKTLDELSRQ